MFIFVPPAAAFLCLSVLEWRGKNQNIGILWFLYSPYSEYGPVLLPWTIIMYPVHIISFLYMIILPLFNSSQLVGIFRAFCANFRRDRSRWAGSALSYGYISWTMAPI